MMKLSLTLIIRIVLGLSIFLILLQISLLAFNCSKCAKDCNESRNGVQQQQSAFHLIHQFKGEIKQQQETIVSLKRELDKYKKLDKYVITQRFFEDKASLTESTFLNRFLPRTEFEVIPYTSFTAQHLYGDIGFLAKKPASLAIGQKGEEMYEVLDFAMRHLNADIESLSDKMSLTNLIEGITRNDLTHGTVYDIYFRSNHSPDIFKRLKLVRPFSSLQSVGSVETMDTSNEWINLILPLSGRLETFKIFLRRFVEVGVHRDRRVFLTVVYFGLEGRDEIKKIILKMATKESFEHYKVIFKKSDFNRGQGLQIGVESWKKGNVLMFFCDVDIYVTEDFLERCRFHSSPGTKVYYPIVFSQYNPDIIYGGQKVPPLKEQMVITGDAGFWRDFGFGMTCQYRNDFLSVGGFDLSIKGWGGEDLALYKRYIHRGMTTVRAYDRNLIHVYHTKNCRKTLSDSQFISCLQSKAASEGSHKQLGMLAFGSNLVNEKDPQWAQRLKSSLNDMSEN